jgi:hypothetical protein
MALVDPNWLGISSQSIALVANGKYALLSDYVDAEIRKDFDMVTRDTDVLPVGAGGYITGDFMRSYSTDLALYRLFLSVAGVRDGQPDIYRDFAYIHEREYREKREKLTREQAIA